MSNNILKQSNLDNMLHQPNFSNDGLKAFCPVCGELKIINGKIIHPALDKILAEKLENGCTTTYIPKNKKS